MGHIEELLLKLSHNPSALESVPVSPEGRVEKQIEPKRPPLLWPFGFVLVFNSIHWKKSDPPSAVKRVVHMGILLCQESSRRGCKFNKLTVGVRRKVRIWKLTVGWVAYYFLEVGGTNNGYQVPPKPNGNR